MDVIVLGAGTAIPAARRSPAGIYMAVGPERILLDAGAGTMQRLHAAGASFLTLDRVFLTHYHIDHCLDLVSLLFALRIPQPARRKKPLTIYGPRGLKRLYRHLNTAFQGWLMPKTYRLTLTELGETTLRLPGYTVTTRRMNHYATGALGYRIETPKRRVAYSGDTESCSGIVELGRGADPLILECSHPDEWKVAGHLSPTVCGQLAAAASCHHLVLTHFYPVFAGYDIRARVRRAYRGRVTLARDLTRLIV